MPIVAEKYGYVYFPTNLLQWDLQKHVWVPGKDLPNIGYPSSDQVEYFMKWVEYMKPSLEQLLE
jgi:hypothetical protein